MNSSLIEIVGKLNDLFDKFNKEFYDSKLQSPIITVSPDTTSGAYGWVTTWKAWMNGKEEFYEINLCAEHLNRDIKEVCATLLHEMAHLWNIQNNVKDVSNKYHNKKFKDTAEAHGLIVEKGIMYGWTKTTLNEQANKFVENLNCEKFNLHRFKEEKATVTKTTTPTKKSSQIKYFCPVCGAKIKANKEIRIICVECECELNLE